MNPTPSHLDDELLSALLDGDRAAGTGGGAPDASAHLRACDRCAGRQAELAGARAALAAAAVEPIDELTRRRLVAAALQAPAEAAAGEPAAAVVPVGRARARWAQRHPALLGSAAAAVLAVLVGVPFVLGNGKSRQEHTALSAQAPDAALESAGVFLGDLGDLTDRDSLRLRLSGAADTFGYSGPAEPGPSPAAGAPTPAPVAGAAPPGAGLAGTSSGAAASTTTTPVGGRTSGAGAGSTGAAKSAAPQNPPGAGTATANDAAAPQAARDEAAGRDRADTDRCVAALLNGPARGGRLTRSGTGTYKGRPAIVASFELNGGTQAFVTDRVSCEVLEQFSM